MLVGGIDAHRHDLSSMIMLKDNHIWSSGASRPYVFMHAIQMILNRLDHGRHSGRPQGRRL